MSGLAAEEVAVAAVLIDGCGRIGTLLLDRDVMPKNAFGLNILIRIIELK